MSTTDSLRFTYRLPAKNAVLMAVVALAVPVGVAYTASTIQKPLRLFGLVTLSAQGAAVFFWVLSALCGLAALLALYAAVRSQTALGFIELGGQGASLPKASLSSPLRVIPYKSIEQVQVVNVPGQQMVIVKSSVGESRLMSKSFASQEEFAVFLGALGERVRANASLQWTAFGRR